MTAPSATSTSAPETSRYQRAAARKYYEKRRSSSGRGESRSLSERLNDGASSNVVDMSSSLTEDNCTKIAIGSHKSDDKSVIPCKNGFRKIDNLICKSEPESENFNDKLLHCKLDTIRTLTETRLHNAITNETSV